MDVEALIFLLKAILGHTYLTAAEYGELAVGDIIILNQKASDPIVLHIGTTETFKAQAGIHETHKAVRICNEIYTNRD